MEGLLGFSSWRKGSIFSAMLNAYDNWLIRPNHERTSVMFFGFRNRSYVLLAGSITAHGDFKARSSSQSSVSSIHLVLFGMVDTISS